MLVNCPMCQGRRTIPKLLKQTGTHHAWYWTRIPCKHCIGLGVVWVEEVA